MHIISKFTGAGKQVGDFNFIKNMSELRGAAEVPVRGCG